MDEIYKHHIDGKISNREEYIYTHIYEGKLRQNSFVILELRIAVVALERVMCLMVRDTGTPFHSVWNVLLLNEGSDYMNFQSS